MKDFQKHKQTTNCAASGGVDLGYELFSLLSPYQATIENVRIAELIDLLFNFYRINAPFGSLQAAMSSGTIAIMTDVELASGINSVARPYSVRQR